MRIALVTDGIWPYVLGGMQKHSFYLCKYLAKQKINVDLFHFNQSEYDITKLEFFSEEEKKYIKATVVPFPNTAKGFGHYLINSYRYSFDVYNKIKDSLSDYDFIYTKGFTGFHFVREKSRSSLKHPPIAVKMHGYEMFQKAPDLKSKLQQILLLRKPAKEISQKADVVFSYGGKITDIIKYIGVKESKIIELATGVEASTLIENITPTRKKIKFLFLGRYERRKGIEELNKAIKSLMCKIPSSKKNGVVLSALTPLSINLVESGDQAEFHFVGPIPAEKQLKSKHIIYHGEIRDKKKLNQVIQSCDVLVCTSWSEGMPNVILEAMANGLAIVATDVGATNVLVSNKTGWLIDKCDRKNIENILTEVIKTDSLEIDKKKQNALNHIKENFIWEKLILNLVEKIRT